MKKLFLIFLFATITFSFAGTGFINGSYVIKFDNELDGKFTEKVAYNIKFNSHQGVFVGSYTGIINDSIFKGKMYGKNKNIIKFTQYDDGFNAVYSGKMISKNKFQGTWYDTKGNSGDFILEVAK